jgi:C-terminal processing protease CtpA/Prc
MRSTRILMTAALPLLVASLPAADLLGSLSPALAGEHKKCLYNSEDCLTSMKARMKAAGWVGITYQADEKTGQVMVQRVVAGSPAEKAGLQEDDVLVAMDGVPIRKDNEKALAEIRKTWKPGKSVRYTIRRGGEAKQIRIVLGDWPADLLARHLSEHMLEHDADSAGRRAPDPPVPPK